MTPGDYDIYQMTEERQKELWANCIFVFDTSALLALYLYPEETRQQIYKEIFEKLNNRLWLPHHVMFEYLKNKSSKIREPVSRSYKPLNDDFIKPMVDAFNKSLNRVDNLKNTLKNSDSHPYMVSEEIEKYEVKLKEFVTTTVEFEKAFNAQMEKKINEILQLEQHDTVYENIQHYFKTGREYSHNEIMNITLEGKHRYEFKIPPGYEDLKDKIGTQIFGDLIIWKQLLEYSKENRKNIVFVCNDLKEDWWHFVNDKKSDKKRMNGPRKELIKEMKDHSGASFWMYNSAKFLDLANTLIRSNVPNRHIEQVSRLLATDTSKWLVYTCNTCQHKNTIDTSTLSLNFEKAGITAEKENKYISTTEFACAHCAAPILARFEIAEDVSGIIKNRQITLDGAALADPDKLEDYIFEEFEDSGYPVEEEVLVIDKKQLRLKAGKIRKLRFEKQVDGNATVFLIDLIKSKEQTRSGRLLIEAVNKQKHKLSKTLVLEQGVSRFVLRSGDENFSESFLALQLTADADITIRLSITEYPGSERYLEKLYY